MELLKLLNSEKHSFLNDLITDKRLNEIDMILFNANIGECEPLKIYKKFSVMKYDVPDFAKYELIKTIRGYIDSLIEYKKYGQALLLLRLLCVKATLQWNDYYNIALCILAMGQKEFGYEILDIYEMNEPNQKICFLNIGNLYNYTLKNYLKAIDYYEKYVRLDDTRAIVYSILANLYKKQFGEFSNVEMQIKYLEKAYSLNSTNRSILLRLAFIYEQVGNKAKAGFFWEEILKYHPCDTDYYNYGAFLISCGDLTNGHKHLMKRFFIKDENLKYPKFLVMNKRWNDDDLTDKTVIVSYEQGFGDTFMYCRYLPLLARVAKKVIFIAQHQLADLLKQSPTISENIEIISEISKINDIEYDYNMTLLDLPYVLKITSDNIPYTEGYLTVSDENVKNFKKEYLSNTNDKLKVGICLSGDKSANYSQRDISPDLFDEIFDIENIDFYNLQCDTNIEHKNVKNIAQNFNDFTDTANAIKNMDLIISTDNVILNLSGALGIKTLGLFNKVPNFRWYKLDGEDVGYYKSVKPIQNADINKILDLLKIYFPTNNK